MQLTKRFFLMNALTVIISIVISVLAAVIFIAVYTKLFSSEANVNDLKRVFEVRAGLGELKQTAMSYEFEQLLDPKVQAMLADRVQLLGGHLVIMRNREVLFSTLQLDHIDIERSLVLTGTSSNQDTLELSGGTFLFNRSDYHLNAGEQGTLLLLAPIRLKTDFYLYLGVVTAGCFILSFLAMNFWVSYRFSRAIILPLSRLTSAAVKIREGDVSGGIAEEGEGEVRELCRALEELRIRLKESIYMQQKYDENRKFLVSSISHDLKTPVTSIIGYIEGIMDGVAATPEKRSEYLATARSKALLVNRMIDDLLLYSKLDLNQLPYHFEKTSLVRYFEDCVSDYRCDYHKDHVTLELVNELTENVYIQIDRVRFGRVIQNILDNAKKYMDKADGRIEITLRETRTSAIVEIKDNGKGIPEGDVSHIFERFYRVDTARKSTDGSGLGLAIAKQIVEGHEGKIWAVSKVGEGTRIMISLKKL